MCLGPVPDLQRIAGYASVYKSGVVVAPNYYTTILNYYYTILNYYYTILSYRSSAITILLQHFTALLHLQSYHIILLSPYSSCHYYNHTAYTFYLYILLIRLYYYLVIPPITILV